MLKFKKAFLRGLKPEPESDRSSWHRFVLIRPEERDIPAMSPRLLPGATLLIDRHYNSLRPYRKGEFNMYAVLKNDTCAVRYVAVAGNQLVLRPHNQTFPLETLPVEEGRSPADYLVGRVCQVALEI
jgi:hypothetical protein